MLCKVLHKYSWDIAGAGCSMVQWWWRLYVWCCWVWRDGVLFGHGKEYTANHTESDCTSHIGARYPRFLLLFVGLMRSSFYRLYRLPSSCARTHHTHNKERRGSKRGFSEVIEDVSRMSKSGMSMLFCEDLRAVRSFQSFQVGAWKK